MRLVLASASPARLATLRAAGVDPVVLVSAVDEHAVVARYGVSEAPDVALLLARAKAEDVAGRLDELLAADVVGSGPAHDRAPDRAPDLAPDGRPDGGSDRGPDLVLGCDSVLELDGEVHGKPADAAEAVARWRRMRGRSGVLHTGHWLVDVRAAPHEGDAGGGTGATLGAVASTTVHFGDLDDAEVEAYVATGEPLAVAGAFTLDGLGGPFVRGVEGDPHAVVGLGLPLLRGLLAEVGVRWSDLWAAPSVDRRAGGAVAAD